ncbi:DUF1206 domain-containing protein [Parvularcula sp. ZS-1/3]|uniref:DUF1206 domain-containing protein n=1 Tax=Parvularcula mediterranea TaxID=2732508 RepID=A0A7Y3RJP1_9PROT|nr:DUF1206 domain-containing protein [Parvularcula mediterranea]NNU15319.1 DUF1206 domain-containing protein [Parvularcula mediterranea]
MSSSRKELYEKLARAGFAARGVTYGLIGGLAFAAAIGSGGATTGSKGALAALSDSGWGIAVLSLTAIGLFGYGLWRIVSAAFDLENEGSDGKAMVKRAAHAGSGLFHFGLSFYAIALATGSASGNSSGGGTESMIGTVMSAPAGKWLVTILGAGFVIAGASMLKKAFNEEYREHIRIPSGASWMDPAIKAGIVSRAVVFAVIGGFIAYAGLTADPDDARGIGGALEWLQSQPYGAFILGLIGFGLLGFSLYSFLQARYRTIPDPEQGGSQSVSYSASS